MIEAAPRNIILTGFMGAGKSTVGRALAQRLGYRFADLDQLIVEREGCAISEIFALHGEEYFRNCESTLLAELPPVARTIYATGGGIVARPGNRTLLKRLGTVIYLQAGWPTLERRLARGSGRPLAGPQRDPEMVRQLWMSRLPWYEEADLVVATDRKRIGEVVMEIISRLQLKEPPG